jgi:hypothetical protein
MILMSPEKRKNGQSQNIKSNNNNRRNHMRNILPIAFLIGLMMAGVADCKRIKITDTPQDVSEEQVQAWYAATGVVKTIAETTNGLTDAVIAIKTSDPALIPDDDYQRILQILGESALAGVHVDEILREVPDNFGKGTKEQILALVKPVVEQLRQADLEGLFSKSQSPRLQKQLTVLKRLTDAADLLLSLAQ